MTAGLELKTYPPQHKLSGQPAGLIKMSGGDCCFRSTPLSPRFWPSFWTHAQPRMIGVKRSSFKIYLHQKVCNLSVVEERMLQSY